jgi:GrpB-like predicted nucleotidyltransferase (UPF0157 family)
VTVLIGEHRLEWEEEFEALAARLRVALGRLALRIDHIGSTSVKGLPAKDVIDVQVIVHSLEPFEDLAEAFARAGFTRRAGDWNLRDHRPAGWIGPASDWEKLVFSPAPQRLSNVHVRVAGRANERYALLFRDYLRANAEARDAWAQFKIRLAEVVPDPNSYGQVKDPATDVLLIAAEEWARQTRWTP